MFDLFIVETLPVCVFENLNNNEKLVKYKDEKWVDENDPCLVYICNSVDGIFTITQENTRNECDICPQVSLKFFNDTTVI